MFIRRSESRIVYFPSLLSYTYVQRPLAGDCLPSLPKYPRLGYLCVPTIHAQGLVAVLLCISHSLLSRVWFYYALASDNQSIVVGFVVGGKSTIDDVTALE